MRLLVATRGEERSQGTRDSAARRRFRLTTAERAQANHSRLLRVTPRKFQQAVVEMMSTTMMVNPPQPVPLARVSLIPC